MLRRAVLSWFVVALVAAGALTAGCSRKAAGVKVMGSTSIQPFAEMLAEEYNSRNALHVEVDGGGSTAGLQGVESGIAHIGMCSRSLKSDEHFTPVVIALDGVAVIVHPENPVTKLTRKQVRDLFAGKITNWSEVGGANLPVHLITREEGSGTREAFTQLVMEQESTAKIKKLNSGYKQPATMPVAVKAEIEEIIRSRPQISMYSVTEPSNGSVKALVEKDKAGVGYMSLGQVDAAVKALEIDGIVPTNQTVTNGKYPLVRPFLFVLKGQASDEAQKFIDFVLSPPGQQMLQREGLVPAPRPAEAGGAK